MKIKPAAWTAPLSLFLAIAGCGVGFAQSPPKGEAAGSQGEFSGEMVVASLSPTVDSPAETGTDLSERASLEPPSAEPPALPQSAAGRSSYSRIGIGVKFSTLGVGVEVGTPLGRKFNVRGGFNIFRYSRLITSDGIQYDGQLRFQSAEAHLDWFPFGGFHISPGLLFYNGNNVTATAMVPGGQTFSEGGVTYESDPTTPVTGSGKLDFVKVSPTIMFGVGNLIPRNGRHYIFLFEVGAAYQGSARVALNLAGNVCDTAGMNCRAISSDPTVQSNIQAQQVKIQNDVNPYRFYPVISLGVGFNF